MGFTSTSVGKIVMDQPNTFFTEVATDRGCGTPAKNCGTPHVLAGKKKPVDH
jgi:hypothetical protein